MDKSWGSVILSGGKGRRMGYEDKSGLSYRGETFLEAISRQLGMLGGACYLSRAAYKAGEAHHGFTVIEDTVKGKDGEWIGPMGGIWSCFERTGEDCLFFVSCDMPMFRSVMAERLLGYMKPGVDVVLWRTRQGRIQPMCGLYSRSCVPVLKQHMEQQDYRMMGLLDHLECVVVETSKEHIPDQWFMNVNTPEIYGKLKQITPSVLAVSGSKNTGKTWLLEHLVSMLSRSGVRVAVIKHDGHEFEADVPGTDSHRMKKAGAFGTVVYSGSQYALVKSQAGMEAGDFFGFFPEADLILLEGQKYSSYPKIEVLRQETSCSPVCRPQTVLAYVADCQVNQEGAREPRRVFTFDQMDEVAELVIGHMDGSL